MTVEGQMFKLEVLDECDDDDDWPELGGSVSWAPAGTDPTVGEGWTELGFIAEGSLDFGPGPGLDETRYDARWWSPGRGWAELSAIAGDAIETFSNTTKHEFPRVSREAILVAMGEHAAEIVREQWPPEPDPLADLIRMPITVSPFLPPDTFMIGAHGLGARMWPLDENRTDHFLTGPAASAGTHERGGAFDTNLWTYLAAERIAMSIPRYGMTVTSEVPTIGRPPRKRRGLTGRRYRIARRAYARKRRAWIRDGSPTYATAIHMPHVILAGIDIT